MIASHIYSIMVISPATIRKAKLLFAVKPDAELLSVVSVSWLKPLSVVLDELEEVEFPLMELWLALATAVVIADMEPECEAAIAWDVMTDGWEVTLVGMPVMTPLESVSVR